MKHTTRKPLVSIGLAVYNGEKYLKEAIESILAQTFTDFELIISDNASTDKTEAMCRQFAAQDPRIRYSRNETNIGGANNENLTVKLAHGKYFRWAAHDDVCAPTLLEECVAILERYPDVVLCHTAVTIINEQGVARCVEEHTEGTESSIFQRFRNLSDTQHMCEATYGLVRADILKKTRLQPNYTGSDRVLLCELAFYGRFYQITKPLFCKRVHDGNQYFNWTSRMAWFFPDLQKTGKITWPIWTQFFDYFLMIHNVQAAWVKKLPCYLWMLPWLFLNGRDLLKELFVAAQMILHPLQWRQEKYANFDNPLGIVEIRRYPKGDGIHEKGE